MSLEITLQSSDKEHLEKFRKALNSNVPIRDKTIDKKYTASKIVINCTSLCKDLIALGCTPRKSLTLTFPKENILPHHLIPAFIRGYFDGDGGVSYTECQSYNKIRNKYYQIHHFRCYFCGNKQFVSEIRKILIKNNINVSDVKQDARSQACNIYIYGKENIQKFQKYIYNENSICLSRKFDKFFYVQNETS